MKITNLLYQPLELDFGSLVVRFNSRETKPVPHKYKDHPVLKRNKEVLQIEELTQSKKPKQKVSDKKQED